VHEHGVASAAHVREREQCRGLDNLSTLGTRWVGTVAVSRRGDVVYPAPVELCRVDKREDIKSLGEISSGGSGWVGGSEAIRVMNSEFL
jgi:hypothetical protein